MELIAGASFIDRGSQLQNDARTIKGIESNEIN